MKTDRYDIIICHGKQGTAYSNKGQEPPAYLPHQSKYTNLVVLGCHVRLCHSAPVHTFTAVRISFWIPKGKPTTQVIIDDLLIYTLGVGRGQDECIGGTRRSHAVRATRCEQF